MGYTGSLYGIKPIFWLILRSDDVFHLLFRLPEDVVGSIIVGPSNSARYPISVILQVTYKSLP